MTAVLVSPYSFSCPSFFFPMSDTPGFVEPTDSLFLRVVVPESDTIVTTASRQRISASTLPTARAFINGKEAKVYASGAFCGIVNVAVGSSILRLVVQSANGDSVAQKLSRAETGAPQDLAARACIH